jgi:lysozyme family protein
MTDMMKLADANARRFAAAVVTRNVNVLAHNLVAEKARYMVVSIRTGVPWFIIAVIHMRESSQNWTRSLAQGDPWNEVSVHVPAGRGPFKSWEEAAIDALVNCHPYLARKKDWSLGSALANLEAYNGLGYASRGRPSPYLWAGTSEYVSGKFVRDGVYDAAVVDKQPGCAALIKTMMAIDPTITFTGAVITTVPVTKPAPPEDKPVPPSMPTAGKAAAGGGGGAVVAGTVAAGVNQGWTASQWAVAALIAGVLIVVGAIAYKRLKS